MSAIVKSKPIKWMYVVARATTPCIYRPVNEFRFYVDPKRIKMALDSLGLNGEMHQIEYDARRSSLFDNPMVKNLAFGSINERQLKQLFLI
jgi:hypothetical protein